MGEVFVSVSKIRSLNTARFTTSWEGMRYNDIVSLPAQSPPSSGKSGLVVHITVDDGRRKFQHSFGLLISYIFMTLRHLNLKNFSCIPLLRMCY